jgi:hypothetical protein
VLDINPPIILKTKLGLFSTLKHILWSQSSILVDVISVYFDDKPTGDNKINFSIVSGCLKAYSEDMYPPNECPHRKNLDK